MKSSDGGANWAILIASKRAEGSARLETQQLLERAGSLAAADKICAIIAQECFAVWRPLADSVLVENVFLRMLGESTQAASERTLRSLSLRELRANVVLVPADHCAAGENAWVVCVNKCN